MVLFCSARGLISGLNVISSEELVYNKEKKIRREKKEIRREKNIFFKKILPVINH